jgi:PKD repeat protein
MRHFGVFIVVVIACIAVRSAQAISVPPTTPPSINAGPDRIANASIVLDATTSGATLLTWTQVNGPLGGVVTFGTPLAEDTTASANIEGVYTLRLTGINLIGVNSDDMTFTWDVTAPVITPLPNLSMEGSPGGGTTVTYGNPAVTDATATALAFSHPSGSGFPVGVTQVTITATDGAGNSSTSTFNVTITDTTAPAIVSAPSATPNPAVVGSSVSFSASASDATALTYAWTFGDGTSGTGSAVTHAYASTGVFTVALLVTDATGRAASSSVVVTVNAAPTGGTGGTGGGGTGGTGGAGGGTVIIAGGTPGTPALPLTILKLNGNCRFDQVGRDSYLLQGAISLPQNLVLPGAIVELSLGGAKMKFPLDARGRSRLSGSSFMFKTKRNLPGLATFQARVKGPLQASWTDEGLSATSTVLTTNFTVELSVNTTLYGGTTPVGCKIKLANARFKR